MRLALFICLAWTAIATPCALSQVADFESRWGTIERTWIGPEYWANRLQDWRLADGGVECVEHGHRFPLRTLFLLTHRIGERGPVRMVVRIAPHDFDAKSPALAGVLLGVGGAEIDYRLSAQVHHRPGEDGGFFLAVDRTGTLRLFDMGAESSAQGGWSVGGALGEDELPEIMTFAKRGQGGWGGEPVTLAVSINNDERAWGISARVTGEDGIVLSEAMWPAVRGRGIDGSVALVSHLGKHRFEDWRINGEGVDFDEERAWGPVLITQHTLDDGDLALTAQLGPLGPEDTKSATLRVREGQEWRDLAVAEIAPDSWTATFRVPDWDTSRDVPFGVVYDLAITDAKAQRHVYEGVVRAPPEAEVVIASLNCAKNYTGDLKWNHDSIWFPHGEVALALKAHDPDLLFFAGDQIYEGDLDPVDARSDEIAINDYLYKWYRWCWSFHEVTRDRPTVTIPDDHDVYHGNIWGAGGVRARASDGLSAQDSGGYKMSPRFVNAVHRTQTSHLPTTAIESPIGDGYTAYTTSVNWAGLSLAVLADRQFKSAPARAVPEGEVRNGWFQNEDFDPRDANVPGAELLGAAQEDFLRTWAVDFGDNAWAKVVLSQTPFANVATLPEGATSGSVIPSLPLLEPGAYPENYKLAADCDSNGWPQSARDRAISLMRRGLAIHLAGDQHLATLIRYGVDDFGDGGIAFTSPAISNTWPRRFFPAPEARAGAPADPDAPGYTGDFFDGFGNRMTVYAVANPYRSGQEPSRLHDRVPGYGLIRLRRETREARFECWPRSVGVDTGFPDEMQYAGWPRTFRIDDLSAVGTRTLVTLGLAGGAEPVVRVLDGEDVLYALRGRAGAALELRIPGGAAGPFFVEVEDESGMKRFGPLEVGAGSISVR